jgi:type IV secretion system protein VirB6
MAVYVMSFIFIAVLMGLAPLFLTFMLFESTRHLFDNWVKFTVKYMLEPLILLAGIIILTQLFTIYLDIILGYSVCWKCTLPIRMPFVGIIPGMPAILKDTEIFCIYWFGPWGMDFRSGALGINMQHMIALIMLAYAMYGYVELAGNITTQITGSSSAPSATNAGKAISQKIENSVMKSQGLDQGTREQIGNEKDANTKNRKEDVDRINKGSSKETSSEAQKD